MIDCIKSMAANFGLYEVLELMKSNPELSMINAHVQQKSWFIINK